MERDRWGIQVRIRFGDLADRMGGMYDLLLAARGCSLLDVGCNRGLMCYLFAQHGAKLVHGIDYSQDTIDTARDWFADLTHEVQSQFDCIDLAKEPELSILGKSYDIVLFSAVIHKLRRQMPLGALQNVVRDLGNRSRQYVAARVIDEDLLLLDQMLRPLQFRRVHWSVLNEQLGQCCIWRRS